MVELSILDEKMLEHCFTEELSIEELSEINELSEIVDELSIVELSTVYELFDGQIPAEITDESPPLPEEEVSASLDEFVSPDESSDEDPPPPLPPPPQEITRRPNNNTIIRESIFFIL
tara:strand:- start:197 stop:550 length:354 start_codon:yes stop_codon:yes gene_type:complete